MPMNDCARSALPLAGMCLNPGGAGLKAVRRSMRPIGGAARVRSAAKASKEGPMTEAAATTSTFRALLPLLRYGRRYRDGRWRRWRR